MIPYGRQSISDADIEAVVAVLKSDYLTQGQAVPAFEQGLANYCQVPHVVACSNGTTALHLACAVLELGAKDTVWVSAVSFVASANCVRYCDANVDFVDVEPATGNLDVVALNKKLQQAVLTHTLPKALIAVHLAGQPCDLEEIGVLCRQYGIILIEDACHALGAHYQGSPIGSCLHSDMTVFSFHPVKPITTAEGGAVTTRDQQLAAKLRLYRSHGITRDPQALLMPSPGEWYYEQQLLGFNYRLTDIQAALGLSQLSRLDQFIAQRRELARRYDELLSPLPVQPLQQSNNRQSGYHLYVIQVAERDQVFARLRAADIGVNVHYIPIPAQPYYRGLGHDPAAYPGAQAYYQRAISLPLFPALTYSEQQQVVDALEQALCG
ncbi:UDP-4-amino-4,6-dideoxy-N-acetyl-beta-L-altrosamine transaminase [Aeromonas hydrophila]|uniref:UDP-4-amino-4, 6-dideoxy-N-acetyl-beta-L-altrosamine transaminase n=1 Tax=Aeromonas hydrophila TaxID=644 RepID=UPI001914DEA4|nr:UDP-4-amino-4,6-dideoxy-N-acetyl-beta-L-altrosamine transaminase [Aeromonas hydrophila]MBQ4676376.1 UDP-4-amino-4,6-dideoxy-N-acetyl-beta-L-altrosamine transaminase [Aeromonas hydrophila]MBW3798871.1 UDP-4-amino-4,6-dideoxy-N-acetyl-beta-L-altrosamine transaminase [Aeromonas hydrophila]MBW3801797.1 UDP-4-amino-4,6-dideoxy-N-acetyl-beta-L-altrosamine transaminase [Aeromonas hydrophila]MBW3812981.1 UDP-4-amino-4,6-dideoxy-N-acetyl-beta-L-altrosamine transaminase [Aeromonas hydrophila]MBW38215